MVSSIDNPHDERVQRMLDLCEAGTVEEILAKKNLTRQSPPPPSATTSRIMQLAADDAARRGQKSVTTENMLVGLLRQGNSGHVWLFQGTGIDMAKLHALIEDRLHPDADPLGGQELPADTDAAAALHLASAEADSRRRKEINSLHLLLGILSQEDGPGGRLLSEAGADLAELWERFKRHA